MNAWLSKTCELPSVKTTEVGSDPQHWSREGDTGLSDDTGGRQGRGWKVLVTDNVAAEVSSLADRDLGGRCFGSSLPACLVLSHPSQRSGQAGTSLMARSLPFLNLFDLGKCGEALWPGPVGQLLNLPG